MSQTQCRFVQVAHLAYVLFVYYLIPLVFTSSKVLQLINLCVITVMLTHWKASDDKCVLDTLEDQVCDQQNTRYRRYNWWMAPDRMTFSNGTQMFLSYAVTIALLTLNGYIVPVWIRILIFLFNQSIIYQFIPLRRLFSCNVPI